jgi:hypothetical protein
VRGKRPSSSDDWLRKRGWFETSTGGGDAPDTSRYGNRHAPEERLVAAHPSISHSIWRACTNCSEGNRHQPAPLLA